MFTVMQFKDFAFILTCRKYTRFGTKNQFALKKQNRAGQVKSFVAINFKIWCQFIHNYAA